MNTPADHEAYLRAALHAAADPLEPRGDGLERISVRLQHRPRAIAWTLAAVDALRLRTPVALEDGFHRLSTGFWAAWERFAPDLESGKHRSRTLGWLRPLAAMAAVIFIVAAGTYVAIDVSTAVSPSSQSSHPRTGGQPGTGGGHPLASLSPVASHAASGGTPRHVNTPPPPSCGPSTSPAPTASPSCGPSTSPAPSPSPSMSPSPSASPTPTPSDSTTDSTSPDPGSS